MNSDQITAIPRIASMFVLILVLIALQRKQPRISIGGWMLALILMFCSEIVTAVARAGQPHYNLLHVLRLNLDLGTAGAIIFFTAQPLLRPSRRSLLLMLNMIGLFALEILYGCDVRSARPYVVCCALSTCMAVYVAFKLRRVWYVPVLQASAWSLIAAFASVGNFRAAASFGLGATYLVAAFHVSSRLQKGIGRAVIFVSLILWALTCFTHPWALPLPRVQLFAVSVWNLQKFFVTIGMLLVLLEDEIREHEQLAYHDQLTGLPNRRLMKQRLLEAMQTGDATILLLDLDGFKNVNDSLGHVAGDEMLQAIARRLTALLDPGETLARLGGDEFLIISHRPGNQLAEAIQNAFARPFALESGHSAHLGVSLGISLFPEDSDDTVGADAIKHLLRAADHRMYAAKRQSTLLA